MHTCVVTKGGIVAVRGLTQYPLSWPSPWLSSLEFPYRWPWEQRGTRALTEFLRSLTPQRGTDNAPMKFMYIGTFSTQIRVGSTWEQWQAGHTGGDDLALISCT